VPTVPEKLLSRVPSGPLTSEAAAPSDVVLHFAVSDTGIGIPLKRNSASSRDTEADGTATHAYGERDWA
jgi:hypothetical protein